MSIETVDIHGRTRILLGDENLAYLGSRNLLVVGLGGVGSYAAEALARAGIGALTLVDHDTVHPSNINRQIVALHSTLGQNKAEVMTQRLQDINPTLSLQNETGFLRPENVTTLLAKTNYHFVLDCIDSIYCKAALVAGCQQQNISVISAMGAGGRLNPTSLRVERLDRTRTCPLAREMRKRMRDLGANLAYPVIYSTEQPRKGQPHAPVEGLNPGRPRSTNGTVSWLPGLMGLTMAGHVINVLLEMKKNG